MYEEMRLRPGGDIVRVYEIKDGEALVFNKAKFMKDNQGWMKVKVNKLVPMDFELYNKDMPSATKQNKAKKRMKIESAVWLTSDGKRWPHEDLELAIAYEINLMEAEKDVKEMEQLAN